MSPGQGATGATLMVDVFLGILEDFLDDFLIFEFGNRLSISLPDHDFW